MHKNTQRAKTGVPGLDEVLHGGLISKRLYLIDGNPGAGKTTFALQFLLEGMRAGEKCLYVTLSETKQELEEGAESDGYRPDFRRSRSSRGIRLRLLQPVSKSNKEGPRA